MDAPDHDNVKNVSSSLETLISRLKTCPFKQLPLTVLTHVQCLSFGVGSPTALYKSSYYYYYYTKAIQESMIVQANRVAWDNKIVQDRIVGNI